MSGTRSRTVTQTYTWPHVLYSLIDRYLTGTELQNAYDRVTLIAQRTNEAENEYADRISGAARDCANVFEDHAVVHYYVRGLLETTRERVILLYIPLQKDARLSGEHRGDLSESFRHPALRSPLADLRGLPGLFHRLL